MKVEEIARLISGKLRADGGTEIFRAAGVETAAENEISYIEKAEFAAQAQNTKASCLIVPENFSAEFARARIEVKNPKLAFARIAAILHAKKRKTGIHPTAQIGETAKLGEEIYVGAFVSIGENTAIGRNTQIFEGARVGVGVTIGENCFIHPNVVIYDDVSIGDDVVLHSGATLGADGFGFVRDGSNGFVKFPQIGAVVIENRVEIGANTCIDRGSLGETRIGAGTKIDNLVQIAHNVRIGKRVVIAAQTGISGSTIIEDDCVIGGQVGMGDHAKVLTGAIIGSQAGVLPGKIVRSGVWWGTPVQPLDEYKRQNARLKGISRLKEEIKKMKKQLAELINKAA
ncbi:MAG TPA: UDP-3-O-(3-hydroxymyristoyl)glucosamine N-acyltransferase [Pyrinomonadaceae bacterium]|nr:UDP-3-O-(3-hydroxymyristoyl)glucosamine N-acyltransferase [Pyrinomonadaceae bacterium]